MAAGLRQCIGNRLVAEPAGIALVRPVDDENDGANGAAIRPHLDPARIVGAAGLTANAKVEVLEQNWTPKGN